MTKQMTPYDKYIDQKRQFKFQNKTDAFFQLTFEEWLDLWMSSGHYDERGRKQDQYALYRPDPTQPLSKHNAIISTNHERVKKINLGKKCSDETKEKMRQKKLGVPKSEEHKRNMSIASIAAHKAKGHTMKK